MTEVAARPYGPAQTFRALLRVGFKEAVAYRAELFIWMLSTTMPLVMLALFAAVARDAPLGQYGERDFIAYFLSAFLVRQLTGSWAAWQISLDIREGTMATRLLRPVNPLLVYALEGLAAIPMRLVLAVPLAAGALLFLAADRLSHSPLVWGLWLLSLLFGWLLTLFINFFIGCFAFFVESSARMIEVYLALYFVTSGYVLPNDLFPPAARAVVEVLPFRYQLAFPIELMTGRFDANLGGALIGLAAQVAWTLLFVALTVFAWRRGLRRYGAFGG